MDLQAVITAIIGATLFIWCLWQRMSLEEQSTRISNIAHRVKDLEDRHKVSMDAADKRIKALRHENTRMRVALGEMRTDEDVFPSRQNLRVSFNKRGGPDDGGDQS